MAEAPPAKEGVSRIQRDAKCVKEADAAIEKLLSAADAIPGGASGQQPSEFVATLKLLQSKLRAAAPSCKLAATTFQNIGILLFNCKRYQQAKSAFKNAAGLFRAEKDQARTHKCNLLLLKAAAALVKQQYRPGAAVR
jgi:tetratricopeptide (TPR) repeat protein